ncbi:MAG: hypothetical protein WC045_02230 [Patescibacteria group bacterium]
MSNEPKPIILIAEDDPDIVELMKAQIEMEELAQFDFIFTDTIAHTVLQFMLSRDQITFIALDGILKERLIRTFELPKMFRWFGYEGPIVAISNGFREQQILHGCDTLPSCPKKEQLIQVISDWAKNL